MSPDPYPEVSGDESGIVPPQSTRPSEWPKKLRTLTAAELDRLTIDNTGRFYWDGKVVSYETGSKQLASKSSDTFDRSMDLLDRTSTDFGGGKSSPATIEGELARLDALSRESRAVDLNVARAKEVETDSDAHAVRGPDQRRLTLSNWQTAGAVIAVIGIVIGAFGMATYGYVAAREWGCKTGTFQSGCPAVQARPPARPDIPA